MNGIVERGIEFACEGASLVGVLAAPVAPALATGVVIAVGGPQYRAGSHRQFVLLARRLAQAGHAVLRFDFRGMGDSSGDFPGFEAVGPDLAAAQRTLRAEVPAVQRVVVWGLCDAASAALLHAGGAAGLVLLNPWVRHADTHARTEVKQYYGRRLLERAFWRKLIAGGVDVGASAREFAAKLARALRAGRGAAAPADFRERMARGAGTFGGPQLYILSGRDHVAAEFIDYSRAHPALGALWRRADVERLDVAAADHTFSSHELRRLVEDTTLDWLARRFGR
jgi:exosortase A-associated hydrolase 1